MANNFVGLELGDDGVCVLTFLLPREEQYAGLAAGERERLMLAHTEHRFNQASCEAIHLALDRCIEHRDRLFRENKNGRAAEKFCVITTNELPVGPSNAKAAFSQGIDAAAVSSDPAAGVWSEGFFELSRVFLELIQRILAFPAPTICAINGHAVAGGFIFALAHDIRVMRNDRGFLWFPEVTFGLGIGRTFSELILSNVPPGLVTRDVILFGKKATGDYAVENKLIDISCPPDQVLSTARAIADEAAKLGNSLTGGSLAASRAQVRGIGQIDETVEELRRAAASGGNAASVRSKSLNAYDVVRTGRRGLQLSKL